MKLLSLLLALLFLSALCKELCCFLEDRLINLIGFAPNSKKVVSALLCL